MKLQRPSFTHLLAVAAVAAAPLFAHASDQVDGPAQCKKDQVFIEFLDHKRCYENGDKLPDSNGRPEVALKDWKRYGLPAPKENTQWVKSGDHYLLVNRENSTLMEIRDKRGHAVK